MTEEAVREALARIVAATRTVRMTADVTGFDIGDEDITCSAAGCTGCLSVHRRFTAAGQLRKVHALEIGNIR